VAESHFLNISRKPKGKFDSTVDAHLEQLQSWVGRDERFEHDLRGCRTCDRGSDRRSLAQRMQSDLARWRRVVSQAGIAPKEQRQFALD